MPAEFQQFEYVVEQTGRLDKFMVAKLPEYSRSRLQRLIKEGQVSVDGQPARKSGQVVEAGMHICIRIPPVQAAELQPETIALAIVFENEDVLIVNKAAGMVVHPAAGHRSGTLVNAALGHAPEMTGVGGEHRPGLVHRLDKDTSGLIILAKNDLAHQFLQDQFRDRRVRKSYLALVDGAPPTPEGLIEAAIGRDNHNRKRMAVAAANKGREAITKFETVEAFDSHALLSCQPITGRTHQIRVHLAFLGCPIVGDRLYGLRKPSLRTKRQLLHAARLEIILPGEQAVRNFQAELPGDIKHALAILRRRS